MQGHSLSLHIPNDGLTCVEVYSCTRSPCLLYFLRWLVSVQKSQSPVR